MNMTIRTFLNFSTYKKYFVPTNYATFPRSQDSGVSTDSEFADQSSIINTESSYITNRGPGVGKSVWGGVILGTLSLSFGHKVFSCFTYNLWYHNCPFYQCSVYFISIISILLHYLSIFQSIYLNIYVLSYLSLYLSIPLSIPA